MSSFVGRAHELDELHRSLAKAIAGDGGVFFITGEPGAGKSSLVEQFLLDATLRQPDTRVIAAECSEQFGAGEPYQPFVEAFRVLVQESEQTERSSNLRDMAAELAPYWLQAIPVAGGLIAATTATARELKGTMGGVAVAPGPPSEEALFFQFTELLFAAAAEHPVILYLDDLHWADHASVALLGHLARKVVDQRILVLGTMRPADVELAGHPIKRVKLELERRGLVRELALPALDGSAINDLVRERLEAPAAPELVDWLEQRAGTNPLFLSELLQWLVDQGVAAERHGEWVLARIPEEIEIPRTAESAIERRLSQLDPDLYRILEYASVQGREFDSVTLSRLLSMDELELEDQMEGVVRSHQIVRLVDTRELPTGDFASIYAFTHSLVQHVLHQGLQGKRRILLHRKVAEILEETYDTSTGPIVRLLAVHYDEGRLAERAYEFAIRAAEAASRVFAYWDAIEVLKRALRNAASPPQKLEALDRLGVSHRMLARYEEALEAFAEALQLAEAEADSCRTLALKTKAIQVEADHGGRSTTELVEQLADLEKEARELDAPEELCHILWQLVRLPAEKAARTARAAEAVAIAEKREDPLLLARAYFEYGSVLRFGEDPSLALEYHRRAQEQYAALEDRHWVGICHNSAGITYTVMGDIAKATEEFAAAAAIFEEVRDPSATATVRGNLGALLTRMGEWERADASLRESVRLYNRLDASGRVLSPLQALAELNQARGDREGAREAWEALREQARRTGNWDVEIIAHCGLGMLLLEEGDVQGARAELDAAQRLRREEGSWSDSVEFCYLLGARLAAAEGREEEAIETLRAAEEQVAERDRYVWATFRMFLGELIGRKDPQQAEAILEEAAGAFERLGAEPMRKRTEAILTGLRSTK